MSHWTKIKLNINNQDVLAKALKRMGLNVEAGDFTISQYGTSSKANLKVDKAVGFVKGENGCFSMVGDFYHASDSKLKSWYGNNADFTSKLNAAYGIEHAKQQLSELGGDWTIEENEDGVIGKDGLIRMVAISFT